MGKHSAARKFAPQQIDRLQPASDSSETLREAQRRQSEVRTSPAEMSRRRTRNKRAAFGCLTFLVILLLVCAAAAYAYYQSVNHRIIVKNETVNKGVEQHLEAPRKPGDPFYMVLLGEDKRPGEARARSDTLMVAYVDPPHKKISILSIPRDTRVAIPGHGKQKINAAMQLGGVTLVIDTIHEMTGLPISHYMEVDFNGFKDLVDAVGGVTVDVPRRISDGRAADHNWKAKVIEKGTQKLDGAHALTFVRSRKFADGDFTRIKDQQIFLKALAKQTLQVGNVFNITKITDALVNNVTTDLTVPQLLGLGADFKGVGEGGISTARVPGEPKYIGPVSYVILDKPGLMELVHKMENGESLESTSTTSGGVSGIKASNVTITVRNGAGQAGLAAEVAAQLETGGFRISGVGNTARSVYDHTLVVFKTNDAKAQLVHDTLGFGTVVKTSSLYSFNTDILVIVGKDWRKAFPKQVSTR